METKGTKEKEINRLNHKINKLKEAVEKQELAFGFDYEIDCFDLVDTNILPIICVNEKGTVIYSNKSMDILLGFNIKNKSVKTLFYGEEYTALKNKNKLPGVLTRLKKKENEMIPVKAYSHSHKSYVFVPI